MPGIPSFAPRVVTRALAQTHQRLATGLKTAQSSAAAALYTRMSATEKVLATGRHNAQMGAAVVGYARSSMGQLQAQIAEGLTLTARAHNGALSTGDHQLLNTDFQAIFHPQGSLMAAIKSARWGNMPLFMGKEIPPPPTHAAPAPAPGGKTLTAQEAAQYRVQQLENELVTLQSNAVAARGALGGGDLKDLIDQAGLTNYCLEEVYDKTLPESQTELNNAPPGHAAALAAKKVEYFTQAIADAAKDDLALKAYQQTNFLKRGQSEAEGARQVKAAIFDVSLQAGEQLVNTLAQASQAKENIANAGHADAQRTIRAAANAYAAVKVLTNTDPGYAVAAANYQTAQNAVEVALRVGQHQRLEKEHAALAYMGGMKVLLAAQSPQTVKIQNPPAQPPAEPQFQPLDLIFQAGRSLKGAICSVLPRITLASLFPPRVDPDGDPFEVLPPEGVLEIATPDGARDAQMRLGPAMAKLSAIETQLGALQRQLEDAAETAQVNATATGEAMAAVGESDVAGDLQEQAKAEVALRLSANAMIANLGSQMRRLNQLAASIKKS